MANKVVFEFNDLEVKSLKRLADKKPILKAFPLGSVLHAALNDYLMLHDPVYKEEAERLKAQIVNDILNDGDMPT